MWAGERMRYGRDWAFNSIGPPSLCNTTITRHHFAVKLRLRNSSRTQCKSCSVNNQPHFLKKISATLNRYALRLPIFSPDRPIRRTCKNGVIVADRRLTRCTPDTSCHSAREISPDNHGRNNESTVFAPSTECLGDPNHPDKWHIR